MDIRFYTVLASVIVLCIVALISAVYLKVKVPDSDTAGTGSIVSNLIHMFTFGMGAIIGLLAGFQLD